MPGVILLNPITGTVNLSEAVQVASGSVTGLLVGGQPVGLTNPLPITGSISVSPPAVQNVTGSAWTPQVVITGSVPLTGTFGLSGPITGTVGLSGPITGNVGVTNFPAVQVVTGSVGITAPVAVSNFPTGFNVNVTASIPLSATVVFPAVQTITGSVGLTGPVTGNIGVTNFPAVQAVTGTVGLSGPITGNVGITAPVAVSNFPSGFNANITGSIPLPVQQHAVTISGSVPLIVTGSVAVTGQVNVQGNVTASVNGTVAVSNFPATQAITGTVGLSGPITGTVSLSGPVTGNVGVTNFPAVQNVSGSNWTPTITGSVVVANRVDVSGSNWTPTVTGTVGLSGPITGTVVLGRAITGSVGLSGPITGTVGLSGPVTGNVGVTNFPAVQQITGSVFVSSAGSAAQRAGFCFGKLDTSVQGEQIIEHTVYTEMTGNFKLSLVSASGTDTVAAGGTGARLVKVTYYAFDNSGPFTETVQLSGTTAVPLSASTTCYIEKMEVLTAGTYGTNKGTISLKIGATGAGATVGSILGNHGRTYWAHHYIPSGSTCYITTIYGSHFNNTSQGSGGTFFIRSKDLGTSDSANLQATDYLNAYGQASTSPRPYATPVVVVGPARLQMFVFPDAALTVTYVGSFDFYEQNN